MSYQKDNQPIPMSRGQLTAKQIWSDKNSHRFIVSRIPTNINQVQVVDATPIWYGNNPEIYQPPVIGNTTVRLKVECEFTHNSQKESLVVRQFPITSTLISTLIGWLPRKPGTLPEVKQTLSFDEDGHRHSLVGILNGKAEFSVKFPKNTRQLTGYYGANIWMRFIIEDKNGDEVSRSPQYLIYLDRGYDRTITMKGITEKRDYCEVDYLSNDNVKTYFLDSRKINYEIDKKLLFESSRTVKIAVETNSNKIIHVYH